jgi:peptidoglycan/xylan/chitin deacetylase (PgdA/CDA1 family)
VRLKENILTLARHAGLSALARKATARHLRILCYHGLWVTPGFAYGDCSFIPPDMFEARMERLRRSGRPVLPLGEAVARLAEGSLPDAAVAITIDDGWVSTLTHALPVLEAQKLPATLYATTWYSGRGLPVVNVAVDYLIAAAGRGDLDPQAEAAGIETLPEGQRREALRRFGASLGIGEEWLERRQFEIMSPGEFAEARARGLDVQLHTHRHIDVAAKVSALPRELAENRAALAEVADPQDLVHFCYPSGSFHPRAPALLAASAIRSATLTEEGLNAPGIDPLTLRRFLDGRRIGDATFDAYLSGVLHLLAPLRALRGRGAAAPGAPLPAAPERASPGRRNRGVSIA